jgi:DNA-binding PadR family transcriptional regulator
MEQKKHEVTDQGRKRFEELWEKFDVITEKNNGKKVSVF